MATWGRCAARSSPVGPAASGSRWSRRSWPTAGASSCRGSSAASRSGCPPRRSRSRPTSTDPDDVGRAVRLAAGEESAPLGAVANLVGGFAAGQPVADTPLTEFEAHVRAQPAPDLPRHPVRAAAPRGRGRRRDRLRVLEGRARAVGRRGGLRGVQGGGDRVRAHRRQGARRRRRALQRHRPDDDRHAGQPRREPRREDDAAGGGRRDRAVPVQRGVGGDQRRRRRRSSLRRT